MAVTLAVKDGCKRKKALKILGKTKINSILNQKPSIPLTEPRWSYINFNQYQKQLFTKARSNLNIKNHQSDDLFSLRLTIYILKSHDTFC